MFEGAVRLIQSAASAVLSVILGLLAWIVLVMIAEWVLPLCRIDSRESGMAAWAVSAAIAFPGAAFVIGRSCTGPSQVIPIVVGYLVLVLAWAIFESAAIDGMWGLAILVANGGLVLCAAAAGRRAALNRAPAGNGVPR